MSDTRIVEVARDDAEGVASVRELFVEYAEWLRSFVVASTIPDEIASLPEPYVRPAGRLFLALGTDDAACGCVGVRRHSDSECEVKRLFVRPACRSTGLGHELLATALDAACESGYSYALVSTVPEQMPLAMAMYERLGFVPHHRFENHTHASLDIRYLCLDLAEWCRDSPTSPG